MFLIRFTSSPIVDGVHEKHLWKSNVAKLIKLLQKIISSNFTTIIVHSAVTLISY